MSKSEGKMSVSSIIGLVISIIGLLLSALPIINNFAFVLLVISLILGAIGIVKTKSDKKKGRKLAITAIVISVIGIVIVFGSQAFYGAVLNKAGEEFNKSADEASGKSTDKLLSKDIQVTLGAFVVTPGDYITDTKLPVTVKNKTNKSSSYSIQVESVDASGNRIVDETIPVNNLGAGQTQEFDAFKYIEQSKLEAVKSGTFKVTSVSKY